MNDRQALVNVLKNIKGKCDTQIALLGTRVFVQTFSFEKANTDRWSELADGYQSMLDELNSDESEDIFIPVADFDVDEVL